MVYLIILSFIAFLLAFALKLLITYFFIKFFNREKSFRVIFKPILLYELGVFVFFFIDPFSLIYLLSPIISRNFLPPIYFLFFIIALFPIFKFIMKKFSLLDFKKSVLVFFATFVIITPFIFYSKTMFEVKIVERLPIFEEWSYKQEMFQLFSEPRLKSPSEILLEKIGRLNDIFLEGWWLKDLREFIITI